jgi:hypothetical protein
MLSALIRRAHPRSLASALAVAAAGLALALPPAALAADGPSAAELQALVYFHRQNDRAAFDAELRRLQRQFPGWTPPEKIETLQAAGPGAEVDAMYQAVAGGDPAAARALIAATEARFPGWTPPDELTALLAVREAQNALDAALAEGALDRARGLAEAHPDLRRCDRVNNIWRLAELQAKGGSRDAAAASLRGVVATCEDFGVVHASIEKASAAAGEAELRAMVALAKPRFPDRGAELDALERRLVAGLASPRGPAASRVADGAARPAAKAPARAASPQRPRQRQEAARLAPDGTPLTGDDRIETARAAAARGDWAACLAASTRPRSVDLTYQRAWCAYSHGRPLEALHGFRIAAGAGLEPEAARDAGFGMALSYLSEKMTDDAADVAASVDLTPTQRRQVETAILDQRGVAAYDAGEYRRAIAFFDELERLQGGLRMDLALLRGYAHLNLGERGPAMARFTGLHNAMASDRTREAMRAAAPTQD